MTPEQTQNILSRLAKLEKQVKQMGKGAWMPLEEFCALTGCSKGTAYNYSSSGTITSTKAGGLKFKRTDVDRWIVEQTTISHHEIEVAANNHSLTLKKAS